MSVNVNHGICRLTGTIQNYVWGGNSFIPSFLGVQAEPCIHYAEYWLGAHDASSSEVFCTDGGRHVSLTKLIREQSEKVLGERVANKYHRLPFLLKVLDVESMLSIQVHPSKVQAEAGFDAENKAGIPLDAFQRNYKDDNHKPELQYALSDFWLLHGFLPEHTLVQQLEKTPELRGLLPVFQQSGYEGLCAYLMKLEQPQVNSMLAPLLERLLPLYAAKTLSHDLPEYWAAKSVQDMQMTSYDRGIFSIYLFNIVHLQPGEALFEDAGVPHALLAGQAVEIMANSDNVIRGGLTPKYVDTKELLQILRYEGMYPALVTGEGEDISTEIFFHTACADFLLSTIALSDQYACYTGKSWSAEILLVYEGSVIVRSGDDEIMLQRGESVFVFAQQEYECRRITPTGRIFRASLPRGR